jgi:hypothetical protein
LAGRHHTGWWCQFDRRMDLVVLGVLVILKSKVQSLV